MRKVRGVLWTFRGKRLGVLGLAFKGGTAERAVDFPGQATGRVGVGVQGRD
ncbi:hypothetical protein SBA3_640005 [Candidatus Sulfopaludibacter sp. SbA3]|nr:hypothetical protein SBA3_640005 [Candidatus Sulfopaludibacter sp. SbA3]